MIEVNGLVKRYGDRQVLHGLQFSVGVGRVCGLLGPNGSGKSTTMDILTGLLGPSDGNVTVCGFDVVTQTQQVKALVGYLPDNPPLYREMRVREFVQFVAKLHGIKGLDRGRAVNQVIEECDVGDVADRLIGHLSKGYRQRVALCAALVHNPKVLILDEPTEGLDPTQIVHIRQVIKRLAQDRTVMLSSHILSEVQAVCDDVIVIFQGRIAAKTPLHAHAQPGYLFGFADVAQAQAASRWLKAKSLVKDVQSTADAQAIVVDFSAEFWAEVKQKSLAVSLAQINTQLVQQGSAPAKIQEHSVGIEALYFDVINAQGHHGIQPVVPAAVAG